MISYIFYRTRLVPKGLGAFGIIVSLLGFASALIGLFGIHDISLFLEFPTLIFEIAIAAWLIIKGFNQDVLSSLNR